MHWWVLTCFLDVSMMHSLACIGKVVTRSLTRILLVYVTCIHMCTKRYPDIWNFVLTQETHRTRQTKFCALGWIFDESALNCPCRVGIDRCSALRRCNIQEMLFELATHSPCNVVILASQVVTSCGGSWVGIAVTFGEPPDQWQTSHSGCMWRMYGTRVRAFVVGMGRRKQVAGQRSPSHQRRTWEFLDVLSHSGADVAGIVLKFSEVESAVPACCCGVPHSLFDCGADSSPPRLRGHGGVCCKTPKPGYPRNPGEGKKSRIRVGKPG